jgi:hypothetical protein
MSGDGLDRGRHGGGAAQALSHVDIENCERDAERPRTRDRMGFHPVDAKHVLAAPEPEGRPDVARPGGRWSGRATGVGTYPLVR